MAGKEKKGHKKLFIGIGTTIGVLIVLGIVGDLLLNQYLGIGLLDLMNILFAPEIETSQLQKFNSTMFNDSVGFQVAGSVSEINNTFSSAGKNIAVVNNNTEVKQSIRNIFGDYYSLYLIVFYDFNGERVNIFDWSIETQNGEITVFDEGRTLDKYSVTILVDQSIVDQVFGGQASQSQIIKWINQGDIIIQPVLEGAKLAEFVPILITVFEAGSI